MLRKLPDNASSFRIKIIVFLFIVASFVSTPLVANIGQPGIWKAGGGIQLLIEEDSLASHFISLDSERIDLFIYSGFAVIHGRYTFINSSDSDIKLTMGYPVNSIWNGESDSEAFGFSFLLDSLTSFELSRDGIQLEVDLESFKSHSKTLDEASWYTWPTYLRARDTIQFEVVYLTPTNRAMISNMTGVAESHGVMYIFETGATWNQPISDVDLYVHFMDGLTSQDVLGIRPCNNVQLIEKQDILYFNKSDWKPKAGENFYLTYASRKNKYYSYKEAVEDKNQLFSNAKKLAVNDIDISEVISFNCKDVLKIKTYSPMGKLVTFMIGTGIIAFAVLIFLIVKNIKRKRK